MKPSLLGIGAILIALAISYSEADFSRLSFAVLSVFGLALVAGMSIGAWHAKSGARRADFYVGMLSLAIYLKDEDKQPGTVAMFESGFGKKTAREAPDRLR